MKKTIVVRAVLIFLFLVANHLIDGGPFDLLVTFAQTTAVSGTVVDPNGIPYSGALMKAQLVTTAGSPVTGQPTVTNNNQSQCVSAGLGSAPCQMPFQGTVGQFALSSTGSFTVTLQDNTQVTPAATQWLFTVNMQPGVPPPLGTGPQTFSVQITISGASQSITSQLNAAAKTLTLGGGAVNTFNVKNYGAMGDTKATKAASFAALGNTVTDSTNSPFLLSDVGKKIACGYGPSQVAAINTASGISSIASFQSASQVTMADSFIGGIGSVSNQQCIWYTQDDTGAFCCGGGSAYAAAHTSISGVANNAGPSIISNAIPGAITCSGGFAVSGPILNQQESTTGTLGVSLIGQGCFIYQLPKLTNQNLISMSNTANFQITGMQTSSIGIKETSSSDVAVIFLSNPSIFKIEDNRFANAGTGNLCATQHGATLEVDNPSGPSTISRNFISTNQGCGLLCVGCGGYPTIDSNYIGNNGTGGNMVFKNSGTPPGRSSGGGVQVIRAHLGDECGTTAGTGLTNACVQLVNSAVMFEGGVLFGPGASISLDGTSEADVYGVDVKGFTSAANFPAVILSNGSLFVMTNSTVGGNGTGTAFSQISGSSTVQDLGGNVIQNCNSGTCTTATIAQIANAGVNFVFPLTPTATTQLGGSQTVAGNAPTGCTVTGNGTSTCAFDTGSTNAAWTVTITAAGTTTSSGSVSFTLNPSMGTNSTTCSANYQNGTGSWAIGAIPPIFTTLSTTTVAFNINNAGTTLTAASTYKVAGNCYGK